ncbi:AAA family ATPase [Brochothrix campestris]|uniref:AAA+ ATPase domain-containing protein n=2 Tax=Brochothrix campestris TaxID=2757 RepID=W7CJ45_9LIST|nr:AAA family ATPase [Brochothrix campestris]EUJ39394.1 hypothetical protein BCAMP_07155 [Brochothrix campestris FSL F6-1037]
MRYLRSLTLSDRQVVHPQLYPYHVLADKSGEVLVFDAITLLYGENGSGKSTVLNMLAAKLKLVGTERPKVWGQTDYFGDYMAESHLSFETDEASGQRCTIPDHSRYLKSEDVLYEVKKVQQEAILREDYLYRRGQLGYTKAQREAHNGSFAMEKQIDKHLFAQEKFSNGETAMQLYEEYLEADGLYLLDEPEVSLSPDNQLRLAAVISDAARFLNCQFVIATHSPFLLGALAGTIYNLDLPGLRTAKPLELPLMQTYQRFFS